MLRSRIPEPASRPAPSPRDASPFAPRPFAALAREKAAVGGPPPARHDFSAIGVARPAPAAAPIQLQTKRMKARKEAARERAIQYANKGTRLADDPDLNVPDDVRADLEQLDASGPRRSRRKRAIARRDAAEATAQQRALEAENPIVEVGAGTGAASSYLRDLSFKKAKRRGLTGLSYLATDVAPEGGKGGFLSGARQKGIPVRGRTDANALQRTFPPGSLHEVVGANAFGGNVPGASYGLRRFTRAAGNRVDPASSEFDPRLLQGAHGVLKEGGKVRLYGRSNLLRRRTVKKFGKGKGGREAQDLTQRQQEAAKRARFVTQSVKKPNPYLDAQHEDLQAAARLGYAVHVKPIKQDPRVTFQRPDTHPGQAGIPLGEFNTQFVFRKLAGGRRGGVYYHRSHPEQWEPDSDVDEGSADEAESDED